MRLKDSLKNVKKKASEELSKEGLKERWSEKTTHPFWLKVRNVCGSIAGGGAIVLNVLPPGNVKIAVGIITGVCFAVGTGAHLDKSKQKLSSKYNPIIDIAKKLLKKK